ncbi:DUF5018 domain-containing protein [Flavobacterium hydatis]|uniref:DUF5018 domain-containing protein n=1 Tax=Flavobacterium hydatis TaxID=991 RepID=A0A086AUH5_FLAHY|nr:hypothetical protein [Flavobacterium hydatis]KFF20339.1 hypothetical protein IW20_00850 [Flavobacterium hydatis]OXA98371.1 hypothetical protein B0A62_00805 [Flavobacterium hydatis]
MKAKFYQFTILLFISFLIFSCASDEKTVPLSTENKILSFNIIKGDVSKQFDVLEGSVTGKVASDFELNDIKISVSIPKGATISPDPSIIKSITGPFNLTVTAENGDKKAYEISIKRELSVDNFILEANINTPYFVTSPKIDGETGIITKRLPESVDLKNLSIDLKYSKYATITPDPRTVKDYSSPVNFTVKSESGVEKVYQVKLEHMDINKFESCSEANAWKWFGGDDRTNVPDFLPYDRNVGTGQAIVLNKDLSPSVFSIHLREGFRYDKTKTQYGKAVTLKLIIRDGNNKILAFTMTDVSGQFNGGFIPFNLEKLNLFLEAGKTYVFYWYLVNGESLGVMAASSANKNSDSGFCFSKGYYGQSKISENNTLEDFSVWGEQEGWHFNIQLEGKE